MHQLAGLITRANMYVDVAVNESRSLYFFLLKDKVTARSEKDIAT